MNTWQRDLLAVAITVVGFWLLRHELFGRDPDHGEGHRAAHLQSSSDLPLGAGPGEAASFRPEIAWPVADVERTLAEIEAL